ncbi:LysR substrate-binding domain-containing protein [Streptomyces sp. NPDC085946]|uniref:LysR substrate-binding domain-containing protein n=1 Tax=Streptomyces sp. NPDC085946 TaxID=3365744 RepID=UPI0037D05B2F
MRVQKRLVLAGHGWTVLPGMGIFEDVAAGVVRAAPLCEPAVWRSIVLVTPRSGRETPAVKAVALALVNVVDSAVRRGHWPSAQVRQDGVPHSDRG